MNAITKNTAMATAAGSTRESHGSAHGNSLSRKDFEKLAKFIHGYSGIKMPPNKLTMVEGRLRRRLKATGYATFAQYCHYLFEQGGLEDEQVHLIDAVTTNKTEFFREPDHFRILEENVLGDVMRHRAGRKPVKIWSAASSIGAEPYTLAMVAAEFAARNRGFEYSILATDLCTQVLETAVLGIYPEAMMAPVPDALYQRYVLRDKNPKRGLARIVPELRSQVRYARLNLMDTSYPLDTDFDVIFCRNILIYFDKPTQNAVLQRLCSHLRPGGYLFMGHSETLAGFDLPLTLAGPTVFRRN
jgi:chemotaxis protein methyltransferase CheR